MEDCATLKHETRDIVKNRFRNLREYVFLFAVGFYTTFVIQQLWNWFVVPALHVELASYWLIYGITMIVDLLRERNTHADEHRWKQVFMVLEMSVPDPKRMELSESLNNKTEKAMKELGMDIAADFGAKTFVLVSGWAIHTFLL